MGKKKNILVIDDSALMRRVISDIIESDDRFHVFGMAINGLDALSILQSKASEIDAVILDINMPRMDGLDFLREIKKQDIRITVIVVSTVAVRDAQETILALELGAFDFITKPETYEEVKANVFADKLIACLAAATKLFAGKAEDWAAINAPAAGEEKKEPYKAEKLSGRNSLAMPVKPGKKLVAIACSTGGPKALHTVIPALPKMLDAPVLVVQHMPEGFTKSLADRLDDLSKVRVKEAEDGELLAKGTVYIAKGGHHLKVRTDKDGNQRIALTGDPPRHGLLPCADIMFESLVDTDYEEITCAVLTGMGADGMEGIGKLRRNKKIHVIAQNEETCVVYGMPKVIHEAGIVDVVASLAEISDAIINNVGVR